MNPENRDSILYWNEVALKAVAEDFSGGSTQPPQQPGPTRTSRALAIVHIAMHDAHYAFIDNAKRYLPGPPAPAGTVRQTAIACAAMSTLLALYPRQREMFAQALAADPFLVRANDSGWEFGRSVAAATLAHRAGDKSDDATQNAGTAIYGSSCQYGRHRPDPVTSSPGAASLHPRWGEVTLFGTAAMTPLDPFPGANTPNFLTDPVYLNHHRQVREYGGHPSLNSTKRTPDQTAVGLYWGYDGANKLGTPPRLYNQVARKLAGLQGTTETDNARLFMLMNIAMADAGINAWHWKYVYDLWRPVIGIREADPSMGPCTTGGAPIDSDCDPAWHPLGAPQTNGTTPDFTPGFPAYPSGHATFGAAAFQILRLFLRDKTGARFGDRAPDQYAFTFVSDELNGVNRGSDGRPRARHERRYNSLWRAIIDNSISRVYLGVHWRFDGYLEESDLAAMSNKVGGVPLGLCIAEEIWKKYGA